MVFVYATGLSSVSLLLLHLLFSPRTGTDSCFCSILSLRAHVRVTDTQLSRDYSALVHAALDIESLPQSNSIWVIHDPPRQDFPMADRGGSSLWSHSFARGLVANHGTTVELPYQYCDSITHAPFNDQRCESWCGSLIFTRNQSVIRVHPSGLNNHNASYAYIFLEGIYIYLWVPKPTKIRLTGNTSALASSTGISYSSRPTTPSNLKITEETLRIAFRHLIDRPLCSCEKRLRT